MSEETAIEKSSRFMLIEAADNAQILAEINGEMLKDMVYTVKNKSRLSYAGAKFAAIKLGNIHIKSSEVSFNTEFDQWEASAYAYNGDMNITLPGYAEQPRLMKDKGEMVPNPFARRTATSKAVRNALMAVMPADHIAAYMRAAINAGQEKEIKNIEVEQQAPVERPTDTDKVKEIREQAKRDRENRIASSSKEPSQTGVSSIEELEEILGRRIVGLEEHIAVTQDLQGFTIDPNMALDSKIVEDISYIVEGLGGKHREHQTGVGYSWLVPYKQTE